MHICCRKSQGWGDIFLVVVVELIVVSPHVRGFQETSTDAAYISGTVLRGAPAPIRRVLSNGTETAAPFNITNMTHANVSSCCGDLSGCACACRASKPHQPCARCLELSCLAVH
eukprot:1821820-Rhodomonas_salina.1